MDSLGIVTYTLASNMSDQKATNEAIQKKSDYYQKETEERENRLCDEAIMRELNSIQKEMFPNESSQNISMIYDNAVSLYMETNVGEQQEAQREEARARRLDKARERQRRRRMNIDVRAIEQLKNAAARRKAREDPEYRIRERERDRLRRREKRQNEDYRRRERERERVRRRRIRETQRVLKECLSFACHFLLVPCSSNYV